MKKATHNGTCQVCGRTHAINPKYGTVVNHGYTVDYGYFNGICGGANRKPLQIEKTIAEHTVSRLGHYINALQARIDEGSSAIKEITKSYSKDIYTAKTVTTFTENTWSEYPYSYGETWKRAQAAEIWKIKGQADNLESIKVDLANLIKVVHGRPLEARETVENKVVEQFDTYREAYARGQEIKAKGIKVLVRSTAGDWHRKIHKVHYKK